VTEDDPQTRAADEAAQTRSQARGAELRAELAETDARRTEEEADKAHDAVESAQQEERELRERQSAEQARAEEARADAERVRDRAEDAAGMRDETARQLPPPSQPHEPQSAMERPEVLAGAAFAGAFVLARILKRIFD
jgi:cobalamin biosynthesis protein CobT